MKVIVKRKEENRGLIFKKKWFAMDIKIDLTKEEEAAMKAGGFKDFVLFTAHNPAETMEQLRDRDFEVGYLVKKGNYLATQNIQLMDTWEEQFKEGCRNLKAALDNYQSSGGEKDEVFEL